MKIPRIYLDTSAIGGCFDEEFHIWSNALFEDIRMGLFKPVTSPVVAAEIQDAPARVQKKYEELLSFDIEILEDSENVANLLEAYVKHEILAERFIDDMNHIALATVGSVDIVISWNFKHIVRYDKIRQFNAVNIECGYKALEIYTPREVAGHGKEI